LAQPAGKEGAIIKYIDMFPGAVTSAWPEAAVYRYVAQFLHMPWQIEALLAVVDFTDLKVKHLV
jgi:hypothetical protein